MKIKKGDIVGRNSYGKDILFIVERIIRTNANNEICILKGLTERIKADAPIEDLEVIDKVIVDKHMHCLEERIAKRIKSINTQTNNKRNSRIYTGVILHLDGDKKYSEKSAKYYKELGLNAIVKNIAESKQARIVRVLLERYKPDILVITGHDAMIKNGRNFNDIYNYRNSKYFMDTVIEARKWEQQTGKDLVIFAGACQSFFEAIMSCGANFASSPARILIDFIDPLIVAEKVATTSSYKYITINEIAGELRDGQRGIGGSGAMRKKESNTSVI